eukprot:5853175-Amphidinium_carterae.1
MHSNGNASRPNIGQAAADLLEVLTGQPKAKQFSKRVVHTCGWDLEPKLPMNMDSASSAEVTVSMRQSWKGPLLPRPPNV